jgi:hypothetical protein
VFGEQGGADGGPAYPPGSFIPPPSPVVTDRTRLDLANQIPALL